MIREPGRNRTAFSLVELMIAILFMSIGFFGYVALQSRILHSGQRLEEKEIVRSATDFLEALEFARMMLGKHTSIHFTPYAKKPGFEKFYVISTKHEPGTDTSWLLNYPPEFHPGMDEAVELWPACPAKPYEYSWSHR